MYNNFAQLMVLGQIGPRGQRVQPRALENHVTEHGRVQSLNMVAKNVLDKVQSRSRAVM